MPNHAQITVIGHLGKDPVFTDGETPVARFSVAHTRKRKTGDVTTWYNVTAWRQSAKFAAQYLKKGSAVCVVGMPYLEEYQKDGVTKQSLKIDANEVIAIGSGVTEPAAAPAPSPRPASRAAAPAANDDEPPF